MKYSRAHYLRLCHSAKAFDTEGECSSVAVEVGFPNEISLHEALWHLVPINPALATTDSGAPAKEHFSPRATFDSVLLI